LAEELHAEAPVKGDRDRIGRRRYRLDMGAAMLAGELDELIEQVPCKTSSPRGCPDGNCVHIPDRLGLRDEAEQVGDDPRLIADDERRVAKLIIRKVWCS
jgi:hypothetical protein